MLFLAAQTKTYEGRVMCYSKYYETAHHQLPETWSKYQNNVTDNHQMMVVWHWLSQVHLDTYLTTLVVGVRCADIEWPEDDEALSDRARDTIEALLSIDPQSRPDAVGQTDFHVYHIF